MIRTLTALFAALSLGLAAPAFAAPGHGEKTEHAAPADGHGADGAHGDEHGDDGHGDHHYYTADDDGDGTANWLDPDSEQFMLAKLGFHAFNLLLFVGLIVAFVRRPAQDAVRGRALEIRKTITDSAKERDEAKERHEDVTARLAKLEDEITRMRTEAEADAKVEAERMVERAREEATRIAKTAERNIQDEIARARLELRNDAVDLAVELAEGVLRETVTAADQKRLANDFLATLNDGAPADV